MNIPEIGISGFAAYVPRYRVPLDDWCRWTGDTWDKIRNVVGSSFRMRSPNENAYTMAATAVLRLIQQYQIPPEDIGFLGLGTESSTDNSAGSVIIKGMVDNALRQLNLSPLHRACEVPEFKHACLGGVYAMKAAARFLALDGRGRKAIVVCSDIAEYERATSGEPTQGAGAVAMLIEAEPKLLALELDHTGSSSDYRGPDFRKPFARFFGQTSPHFGQPRDFPVFNGKYSTTCYVDEVLAAMRHLFSRIDRRPSVYLKELAATFLHRPYQRMAETGLIMSYLLALALGNADDHAELGEYAHGAGVSVDDLIAELVQENRVYDLVEQERLTTELFPSASQTARAFRETPVFHSLMTSLGSQEMKQIGNLYTASLPAWMAAGLEQAADDRNMDLAGRRVLTIGYGSGDAAEAIPMRFADTWRDAARRIRFRDALGQGMDLGQSEYAALHDGQAVAGFDEPTPGVFYIDRVGQRNRSYDDFGIEYYRIDVG